MSEHGEHRKCGQSVPIKATFSTSPDINFHLEHAASSYVMGARTTRSWAMRCKTFVFFFFCKGLLGRFPARFLNVVQEPSNTSTRFVSMDAVYTQLIW